MAELRDIDGILEQSLNYFYDVLFKYNRFPINKRIKEKVFFLREEHGFEDEEILYMVFDKYLKYRVYNKYNEDKAISTFSLNCVNYHLKTLLRELKKNHGRTIPLNHLYTQGNEDGDAVSLNRLKKLNIDDQLLDYRTPEDLVIAKELFE